MSLPSPLEEKLARPIAPRTPTEELLAGIWAEVLGVASVGVADDFFALGGQSLMAARVMSRVRETFKVELPLRTLFERKTVGALAKAVEAALRAGDAPLVPPNVRASTEDATASFAQQRLWFFNRLLPGMSGYNIPRAWRLEGALDCEVLERSLNSLIARHQGLRTTFTSVSAVAKQVVHPQLTIKLPQVDLRQLSEPAREAEARRLATAEAGRPFDLEQGPLVRGQVLRLGDQSHLLLLTTHHIVSDGWTMEVLIEELLSTYGALLQGRPSALAPLPPDAVWQREWLQEQVLERQLAYWKKQLSGTSPLELPMDRPRPPALTYRGAQKRFVLPRAVAEGLRALSRQESVTPFMALLAGFKVWLNRCSGQADVRVGTQVGGRTLTGLEGLVGFFANTLVMRTDLSGQPTFRQVLGRVRETAVGAYSHQDVPFEKLVEVLWPERSLGRTPLFQVMFAYQDMATKTLEVPGLRATPVRPELPTEMFDLTLFVGEEDGTFAGVLSYSTDLFDAETIERMTGHLSRLIADAVAHPDRAVTELQMLGDAERDQLLIAWNATNATHPEPRAVHSLIEDRAAAAPESVALRFGRAQLTYGELDARASKWASQLRRLGVGTESIVGICADRGIEGVVAMLAVLKAGGAYLPQDPAYPEDRLRFMLEDAKAQLVIIATHKWSGEGVACRKMTVAQLDAFEGPLELAALPSHPRSLAYVLYTSGSTGRPKAAMVEHRSLWNLIHWHNRAFEVNPSSRGAHTYGFGFDGTVCDIWPALAAGASIAIADDETRGDAGKLQRWFVKEDVTFSWVSTPMAELLAELGDVETGKFRLLMTGGDRLSSWGHPRYDLVNGYGPSECTSCSTYARRQPGSPAIPPIGWPIENARRYVLDSAAEPTPLGVPGELYLGGAIVGRGYFDRPDLTAERYVPDPFSPTPGARMYRTGDLVRFLRDGQLEFLGRIDQQVKIRGFRVELGEVEAALLAQPSVREGVVVAREDVPGDKRLVAYVVEKEGTPLVVEELRAALEKSLPEYMLPSAFVTLGALPLTPNGKVDRKALPAPKWEGLEAYVAPGTPTEEVVAGIWAEVLGVERVGAEDNFFELGGHSLSAMRVMSRVQETFKVEVPLRALFESQTVRGVAAEVERLVGEDVERLTEAEASGQLSEYERS